MFWFLPVLLAASDPRRAPPAAVDTSSEIATKEVEEEVGRKRRKREVT